MKSTCISITSAQYYRVAEKIIEQTMGRNYFSGVLEFDLEEYSVRMVTTLMVYYRKELLPQGEVTLISDIIPVWWEYHTFLDGEEKLNDFSFNELRGYIKDLQRI